VSWETVDQALGGRPDPLAAAHDAAARPPGPPQTDPLATKGDEVEEWLDLRFFRPIGARITGILYPTRITPDQVTLISVVIGLVAGHLFVYTSPWINAAGFALFIVSDLFDSADGQLARRRGTSTRLGRALDGSSDGLRFLNLGVHLVVRLVLYSGWSWTTAILLAVIASFSHTSQSATIDFVRHAFLALGTGKGSELDVDEVEVPANISWFQRLTTNIYRSYARLQARLFPQTVALVRATRDHRVAPGGAAAYRERILPLLSWCPWLGQNVRFIVLGVTAVAGWPAGLLWVTVLPMNVIMAAIVGEQERRAGAILRGDMATVPPTPPNPPTPPAVPIGGN
jgi:phosphatidylglycerophosphate synthase